MRWAPHHFASSTDYHYSFYFYETNLFSFHINERQVRLYCSSYYTLLVTILSIYTHRKKLKNLFSKRKKKEVHIEMDSMVSYSKNQAIHILPIPSRTVWPLPLLSKAFSGAFPSIHVTRGVGRICSSAFFSFKNNLWFVCFCTIQISWLWMRHCSHAITQGV